MDVSSPYQTRWLVQKVDRDAPYLARRLAAKYEVTIAEVVLQALFYLDDYLTDGGEIPDGWRTV